MTFRLTWVVLKPTPLGIVQLKARRELPPLAHIHRHIRITSELVDRFAEAPRETQLQVFAQLRARVADDSHTIELAIAGIAVSLLTMLIVPAHIDLGHPPWLVSLITGGMLGVFIAVLLIPLLMWSAVRSNRREIATVWLRAYEDELQRRYSQAGREGSNWRAKH